MNPKISIIMGIYNCAATLAEAIDSILDQTYCNWELIMCDDGSTDNTYNIAREYKEKFPRKIVLIQNERNMGLNKTLNHCLRYATGDFIARMDGDDISLPNRLEKEIDFLVSNPQYDIVSTPMIYFDDSGDWGKGTGGGEVSPLDFVKGTPFCHAPCLVRKEAFDKVNGYSEDVKTLRAEDYDLWFRMYEQGFKGYKLAEPLYKMRDDQDAYHRRKFKFAMNEAYVRFTGYKRLGLPIGAYIYTIRPIIVGLLPKWLYLILHKKRLGFSKI